MARRQQYEVSSTSADLRKSVFIDARLTLNSVEEKVKLNRPYKRGPDKPTILRKSRRVAALFNNALAVLSKMFRWAEEMEVVEKRPRIRLLKCARPGYDFLDFTETESLLKAAEYNQEWYNMIFITLRTGMRYGELCELRWADVDLKNGRLRVRRSYYRGEVTTPKGGREREIPLSGMAQDCLKQHRHLKGELVFCKDDGGRHIHRRADVAIKRICRYAGMRSIGWHVLRHTFASHLAMRGVPMKSVQELLGHASIEMTMRYAHLSPEVKKDAVETLDWDANQGHHRGTKEEIGS